MDGTAGQFLRIATLLLLLVGVLMLVGATTLLVAGRAPSTIRLAVGAPGGATPGLRRAPPSPWSGRA